MDFVKLIILFARIKCSQYVNLNYLMKPVLYQVLKLIKTCKVKYLKIKYLIKLEILLVLLVILS